MYDVLRGSGGAVFDVDSELWKSGVGLVLPYAGSGTDGMDYLKVKHSWERHGVNLEVQVAESSGILASAVFFLVHLNLSPR